MLTGPPSTPSSPGPLWVSCQLDGRTPGHQPLALKGHWLSCVLNKRPWESELSVSVLEGPAEPGFGAQAQYFFGGEIISSGDASPQPGLKSTLES